MCDQGLCPDSLEYRRPTTGSWVRQPWSDAGQPSRRSARARRSRAARSCCPSPASSSAVCCARARASGFRCLTRGSRSARRIRPPGRRRSCRAADGGARCRTGRTWRPTWPRPDWLRRSTRGRRRSSDTGARTLGARGGRRHPGRRPTTVLRSTAERRRPVDPHPGPRGGDGRAGDFGPGLAAFDGRSAAGTDRPIASVARRGPTRGGLGPWPTSGRRRSFRAGSGLLFDPTGRHRSIRRRRVQSSGDTECISVGPRSVKTRSSYRDGLDGPGLATTRSPVSIPGRVAPSAASRVVTTAAPDSGLAPWATNAASSTRSGA